MQEDYSHFVVHTDSLGRHMLLVVVTELVPVTMLANGEHVLQCSPVFAIRPDVRQCIFGSV